MRQLVVFNQVSLDGYFTGIDGDMGWTRNPDNGDEWREFVANNARGGGMLLFGRITYDLMIQYWPTPYAIKNDPIVAERMNYLPKVVFSRTLDKASWNNTKVVKGDIAAEVRKMKQESGIDMVIMGSGTIVAQLAQERLIDEYQFVVIPVVLGRGRTMFEGIKDRLSLKLTNSRTFANGYVVLCYEPVA